MDLSLFLYSWIMLGRDCFMAIMEMRNHFHPLLTLSSYIWYLNRFGKSPNLSLNLFEVFKCCRGHSNWFTIQYVMSTLYWLILTFLRLYWELTLQVLKNSETPGVVTLECHEGPQCVSCWHHFVPRLAIIAQTIVHHTHIKYKTVYQFYQYNF